MVPQNMMRTRRPYGVFYKEPSSLISPMRQLDDTVLKNRDETLD